MEKIISNLNTLPLFMLMSKKLTKSKSNLLKLIAAASMLIDHIGYLYFPNRVLFRIVGRIAFPIFAFQVAAGFKFTSNPKRYLKRLFIFALVSQIPFSLMTGDPYELNVIATFFFAAVALFFIQKRWYFLVIIPLAISYFVPMDYGIYGVLSILIFYLSFDMPLLQLIGFCILTWFEVHLIGWPVQFYSIISVVLILLIRMLPVEFELRLNKYFFYWFYPVHMLLLVVIGKMF
ncbi:TraX family protein [Caldicellulosiruptor saccharolyticus DSM 8903]|uniref:TraX family protein n=1 Tax=Caldicellulosiruptor saccharolyticus (strain ATCC 43494 / DSM 8903 / Tp8T 6331) TaxID=351627 RepID=A4XH28_CALS8|nr:MULTISPECIES: TraX family protein [Caldicellulosiruptor]ABP66213.1 TraX family protein [Caldicellulosiruptor saccharolyticus DSM 8903]